jgi:hypothetical protein
MSPTAQTLTQPQAPAAGTIDVDLLALDLTTCTRCVGTLGNIEAAIDIVRGVLDATGTKVRLRKVVVASEDEARQHRLVSSPTIRIAGRDIVFETLESVCDSCSDLCGCSEGTSCRVWRYQGAEYTEAPVGLIVEALLREVVDSSPSRAAGAEASYQVPANLRDFYAGKASRAAAPATECCSPSEQATCCEPAAKSSCCVESEPASCGCR